MLWFFDFGHVLCNTPHPSNRKEHTSETPKGVSVDDPVNLNMVKLARNMSYVGSEEVFCATFRKAHTFYDVTSKWLVKNGLVNVHLLCNPCPLPEKEGLSAPEVKYNHILKAMEMYPGQKVGMFFDDDPRVFEFLTQKGIPCSLVRA